MKRRFQFALLLLLPLGLFLGLREQQSWKPHMVFVAPSANEIAISPDGKTLVVSSNGPRLMAVDAKSGKLQREISLKQDLSNLEFSPDGTKICGQYRQVRDVYLTVHDIKKFTAPKRVKISDDVERLLWLPKSNEIISISAVADFTSVWDAKTLRRTRSFFTTKETLSSWDTQVSPDGMMIAGIVDKSTVVNKFNMEAVGPPYRNHWDLRLWNTRDGKVMRNLASDAKRRSMLAFSADSQLLACNIVSQKVGTPINIEIWNTSNGQLLRVLSGALPTQSSYIDGLEFSPTKNLLAASYSGFVRLWNADTGKWLHDIELGGSNHSPDICFSPDGKYLFVLTVDGIITRHRIR